ncbi:MAG: sigma-E processing peptidase SpoIIGA [Peptococcaceae bacterium]|jgi:stage II sporulation protein GA (sporulation sigma-E factor processing peptidase)|nr:sigma-E processing peptidase SpoIIGA [Peptococcaceae bacterium]
MNHIVVYGDVLFLVNFLMDFLLLWATARFGKYATSWGRLSAAAFIGAIYGVGMLIPEWTGAYHIYYKLSFPFLLLLVAFGPMGVKRLCQCVTYFYVIGFAMGGAALGGSTLLRRHVPVMAGGGGVMSFSGAVLIFAAVVAIGLGMVGIRYVRKNWRRQNFLAPVDIYLQGKRARLTVLLDTGNELQEPLTKSPVLVLEYGVIVKLLPLHMQALLEQYLSADVTEILTACKDREWMKRLKLIPFQSLGKQHGMLLGFQPDKVVIHSKEDVVTKDVMIAISPYSLGNRGYQGIANTDILAMEDCLREVVSL